VGIEKSRPDYI